MTDYREVTACRLCDSTQLTRALDLGQTPLANELDGAELFPLIVNRCADCGHHQLSIAVSAERLWGPSYPYQSGTSPVFRKHLEALADEVRALVPQKHNSRYEVLEIASNDGTLVDMLSARGLQAVGVDPSGPDDLQRGLAREGWPRAARAMDYHFGFCNQLDFQCILALNVFAHVDDLHGFTAAVKEALAPDGVFIVEVGYLPDVIAGGLFDVAYHEHLSMHHILPLMKFFDRHGLILQRVRKVDSQGGSVRLYVRHFGKVHIDQSDPETVTILKAESEPGIARLRPMIDSRAAALREALNKRFQNHEMVCIYGAPAKLTTLLYATGLESMPFNCVGDDNPRKVGRTTPGNHIPIVSVEEMLARNPDTILVAAWNFFDDIRRRLRGKGFKGSIINPMTEEQWNEAWVTVESQYPGYKGKVSL